jgi:hypothetical protein
MMFLESLCYWDLNDVPCGDNDIFLSLRQFYYNFVMQPEHATGTGWSHFQLRFNALYWLYEKTV